MVSDADRAEGSLGVRSILSEAWDAMYGFKMTIQLLVMILGLFSFFVSYASDILEEAILRLVGLSEYIDAPIFTGNETFDYHQTAIELCLVYYLMWCFKEYFISPLLVGFKMTSVGIVKTGNIDKRQIFSYWHKIYPLFKVRVLSLSLSVLGLMFLVLPGIYFFLAFSMSSLLVADKNMGVLEAMRESMRAVNGVFFSYALVCLMLLVINVVGTIVTLGIASIWLLPWSMNVHAIYYREMFKDLPGEPVGGEKAAV